jgi:hypothetical protein
MYHHESAHARTHTPHLNNLHQGGGRILHNGTAASMHLLLHDDVGDWSVWIGSRKIPV